MARAKMSCSSLACLIKEGIGTDIILHFTCRDRNIMSLQADLIGVHALGTKSGRDIKKIEPKKKKKVAKSDKKV
jgi:hypothetical protein